MVVFLKNVYQLQCLHCLKVANNYTLKNIIQFCLITVTVKVYFVTNQHMPAVSR